jgi:FkbM family methyltransferase
MEANMSSTADSKISYKLAKAFGRISWIRTGIRRRLVRRFFDPLKMTPATFETNFFGMKYAGSFDSVIDWCVYFFGNFAPHELHVLQSLAGVDGNKVYWDIGGNTGHHSLFMANLCRHVHYFEPFPALRDRFRQNVSINQITNVAIHEIGLGDREEKLTYYAPTSRNLGTGSFVESHAADNSPSGEFLIRRADDVSRDPGVDPPDIIKIDVEGFEFNVLRGMRQTLLAHRPVVLMEVTKSSMKNLNSGESLSDFFPYEHTVREIHPPSSWGIFFQNSGFVSVPFERRRLGQGDVSQYLLISPVVTETQPTPSAGARRAA